MNLEMAQYIEVNLVGMAILLIMLVSMLMMHQNAERGDQKVFIRMLICNLMILAADIAIYLIRGNASAGLFLLNHLVCIIYFSLHLYFGYLWLLYSINELFPEKVLSHRQLLLMVGPGLFGCAAAVSSPWTGLIYRLNAANHYIRGDCLWILVLISYLYWAVSAFLAIREMLSHRRIREHSVYFTLLVFPLPTLLGNILQMKYYGMSIVWVCSAVSLLILFISLQNYQISRDVLTGLFNRRQTKKQMLWECEHWEEMDDQLFVLMADVDYFKRINDQYGHIAGDQALAAVASCLRTNFRESDFIGRFGGDEFIVLGHVNSDAEVSQMVQDLHQKIAAQQSSAFPAGSLALSTGYRLYQKTDHLSIDDMINAADEEMYRMKNQKRGQTGNGTSCQAVQ